MVLRAVVLPILNRFWAGGTGRPVCVVCGVNLSRPIYRLQLIEDLVASQRKYVQVRVAHEPVPQA